MQLYLDDSVVCMQALAVGHYRECPGWMVGSPRWGESPVDMSSIEQAAVRLPVGTVTFLLTDVEGSTFLWESAPESMGAAIRRHYQLLDAAIALHGGAPAGAGRGRQHRGGVQACLGSAGHRAGHPARLLRRAVAGGCVAEVAHGPAHR
ncbi:MAG: hypothetical protein ACRDST_16115 [Pseudonocardiaceae bacterium]